MGFIERELERAERALRELEMDSPAWREMYLVRCALAWASDPTVYRAPVTMLTGRTEDTEPWMTGPAPPPPCSADQPEAGQ